MTSTRTFIFLTELAVAVFLLLTALTGCRSDARAPLSDTFVGRVDGTEAFVAVSRVGETLLAYVCDGQDTATWFRGTARGRTLRLTAGDARLRATFAEGTLTGTFTPPGGPERAFTAEVAAEGAGFYRASRTVADLSYVGGWILLSGGAQRGAVRQGREVLAGEEFSLDPAHPTVSLPGGAALTAQPVETLLAQPAPASAETRR